jgi:5-methylcytosine-specific restriction protein A
MTTYLFAWNPKRWQWDDLAEMSEAVEAREPVTIRWSCGNSKRIQKDGCVFLIRLGEQPKGVLA